MSHRGEASAGRHPAWPATYGALVVLAAVALFYSMRQVLWPVLLYPLFVLVMVPFLGDRRHRMAIIAATIVFFIWMLATLGSLLTPFLLSLGLAYILDPVADVLQRRRIPRGVAILLVVLPALAIGVLLAIVGIPALLRQVDQVLQGLPAALENVQTWVASLEQRLARLDLPFIEAADLGAQIQEALDPAHVAAILEERQGALLRRAWSTALGVGRGFGALLGVVGYIVLVPVLLFYLLRDWDVMVAYAVSLIPEPSRERWRAFGREYDTLLSKFLRGQLLAAAIVGVLTWIGLLIAGFPHAGLVGVIAGVFNIVPYLGLIASVIPVIVIAIVSGGAGGLLLRAGIVFAIVQFIDGSITGPRIVGESVGLHPVWVIFALAVAGFAFGFAGLLLAMPLAVLVKLLVREGLARWKQSDMFLGRAAID